MGIRDLTIYDNVAAFCMELESEFNLIPDARKKELLVLSEYITLKQASNEIPKLIVICTHNSRRSHIGQIALALGADYFHLGNIETYSGGTEATAFNPRAVAALERAGFNISTQKKETSNPIYQIKWREDMDPYHAFSKKYIDHPNPQENFAAIMVCTDADEACPLVLGSDLRLALPYDDPKAFDDTKLEAEKYTERLRQITREIFYALSQINPR